MWCQGSTLGQQVSTLIPHLSPVCTLPHIWILPQSLLFPLLSLNIPTSAYWLQAGSLPIQSPLPLFKETPIYSPFKTLRDASQEGTWVLRAWCCSGSHLILFSGLTPVSGLRALSSLSAQGSRLEGLGTSYGVIGMNPRQRQLCVRSTTPSLPYCHCSSHWQLIFGTEFVGKV